MSEDDLHDLSFDWMDAPEPDYLGPLDELFSMTLSSHDMCAAPADPDKKRMCDIVDEYVRRFVRGPRKKLLKRGKLFRR